MSQVFKNLYIGGIEAAEVAVDLGFSSVLTLDTVLPSSTPALKNHHICITDEEDTDILSHLPAALSFVQGSLEAGRKLLVHCRHGVSRSATVILAWVMASESKSVTTAMAQLASVRPQCRPNPGFWRQLNLFQSMGCRVEPASARYIYFCQLHGSSLESPVPSASPGPGNRCSRCRAVLAAQSQVLEHSEGVSPDWCPALEASSAPAPRCRRGVFIVELRNNLDQPSSRAPVVTRQRLDCHKCGHKVGNRGLASCGCGAVLARAAWLNLSKVDPPSNVTPQL